MLLVCHVVDVVLYRCVMSLILSLMSLMMLCCCVMLLILLLSLLLCDVVVVVFGARTPLAVGAADLDGGQVVEKFLEVRVADGRPPGVVSAVMEPEQQPEQQRPT